MISEDGVCGECGVGDDGVDGVCWGVIEDGVYLFEDVLRVNSGHVVFSFLG